MWNYLCINNLRSGILCRLRGSKTARNTNDVIFVSMAVNMQLCPNRLLQTLSRIITIYPV